MIPENSSDLAAMAATCERQTEEVADLLAPLGDAARLWRPHEGAWSALGHTAHLCVVNARYLDAMEARLRQARDRGDAGSDGPYRHPMFARWFAEWQEPPPKRRVRTMRAMVPDPVLDEGDVLERFRANQTRLAALLEAARGVDLGRIRFGSPFAAIVRLSLGTGLALLLAHNRRHIWLIREVLAAEGFPPSDAPGR